MSSGLPEEVVVEQKFRRSHQDGLARVVVSECGIERRSYDLFGRDAVGLISVHANELLPASSDDVGLVAIGAQILHHLEHGLIDKFGEWPMPSRVACFCDPVLHQRRELAGSHPGMSGEDDFLEVLRRELRHRLAIAGNHRLERLNRLPLRMLRRKRHDTVQRKDDLRVDRLLDPKSSILIKSRKSIAGSNEFRAAWRSSRRDQLDDCLLGWSIVP